MKLTFKSNTGRFAYICTAEAPDGLPVNVQKTLIEGIANCTYRSTSAEVDKAFKKAGQLPETVTEPNAEGKMVTRKGGRADVPYNEANVEMLEEISNAKLAKMVEKEGILPMMLTVTGEHVFGEAGTSTRVTATALWTMLQSQPEAVFAMGCTMYGIDTEDYSDESAIEQIHQRLAVQKAKAK